MSKESGTGLVGMITHTVTSLQLDTIFNRLVYHTRLPFLLPTLHLFLSTGGLFEAGGGLKMREFIQLLHSSHSHCLPFQVGLNNLSLI
jgi:hypothetical protein